MNKKKIYLNKICISKQYFYKTILIFSFSFAKNYPDT